MLRKHFIAATLGGVAITFAATANASINFTKAELLGMSISGNSFGYTAGLGTGILTPNPTFEDGVIPMSGAAGAIGNLNPVASSGATAYYGLSAADLVVFNTAISGGGETLRLIGYNDNNQTWDVGIWYETAMGITTAFATLAPTGSSVLSLALPSSVLSAGVAVRSVLTQPDDYHASWSVPEPMTLAVWTGLFGIGALVAHRRQRKVA